MGAACILRCGFSEGCATLLPEMRCNHEFIDPQVSSVGQRATGSRAVFQPDRGRYELGSKLD